MSDQQKDHVVIVDGHRATGLLSEQDAQAEAARRQKLQEAGGQKTQESSVQVKRNICG